MNKKPWVFGVAILIVLLSFVVINLKSQDNVSTIKSTLTMDVATSSSLENTKLESMRKWSVNGGDYVRFNLGASADKLAVDTSGNLYALSNSNVVYKITPEGNVTAILNTNSSPQALVVDTSGNLYVACDDTKIYKVTTNGATSIFASVGKYPSSLVFDTQGNLYVADTGTNNKTSSIFGGTGTISKIDSSGVVSTFTTVGKGIVLSDMIFDTKGNLFVASAHNGTIYKVAQTGAVNIFIKEDKCPLALAFDSSGNLYTTNTVCDSYGSASDIVKIKPTGATSTLARIYGDVSSIAFDQQENLYTVSFNSDVVSKITPLGAISTFSKIGKTSPGALIFDKAGNLFVAGRIPGRIPGVVDKFAPTYAIPN